MKEGDHLQEDLTNRTIALSIRTATLTARTLQNAIRAVLQQMKQEEQARSCLTECWMAAGFFVSTEEKS